MCFAYAFALGLAKMQRDKDPERNTHNMNWISSRHKTNYGPWAQIATPLHRSVGLEITEAVSYKEIAELADMYFVQVHIFDLNGFKPDFCNHSPKRGHADHLFFLQDQRHFYFISNIQGVIHSLRRETHAQFCYDCFGIIHDTRPHNC